MQVLKFYARRVLRKELTSESTKLNINAHQNPATANPGTIEETKITRIALITNVNNPKVRIVIGKVKSIKIGFRTALAIPKRTLTTIAVQNVSTVIPGKIYADINTAIPLTNRFAINFI